MRILLTAAVALLLGATASAAGRPVVVELFTSQGCSSCPPADAFMEELTRTPGVVALTFPVDIWDYLGWADTFAKHEFTLRQQVYAPNLPSRSVYTPQMVIGGMGDVVGSRRDDALAMIAAQTAKEMPGADVTLSVYDDTLVIEIPESHPLLGVEATIWVARLAASRSIEIGGGENTGKTITYSNVARELAPIGLWRGEAVRLEAPAKSAVGEPADRLAVIVQRNDQGPILGAAIIDLAK
jgi:hypothetical protein